MWSLLILKTPRPVRAYLYGLQTALRAMILSWGFISVACTEQATTHVNLGPWNPGVPLGLALPATMNRESCTSVMGEVVKSHLHSFKKCVSLKRVKEIKRGDTLLFQQSASHPMDKQTQVLRFHRTLVHRIVVVHVHHNHLAVEQPSLWNTRDGLNEPARFHQELCPWYWCTCRTSFSPWRRKQMDMFHMFHIFHMFHFTSFGIHPVKGIHTPLSIAGIWSIKTAQLRPSQMCQQQWKCKIFLILKL